MKSLLKNGFFLGIILSVGIACQPSNPSEKSDTTPPPNILVFLVDDLGWADLECYGSTFHETPHIDDFASKSRLFTLAYAPAPVCSPSRAAILSGKNPARLHLTDWTGPDKWHPKGKLEMPDFADQMPLEEITLAEAVAEQGYSTCFLGKWHIGWGDYAPQHQGFQTVLGASEAGGPPTFFYPYYKKSYEGTGWPADIPGLTGTGVDGEYLTDRLTDEAVGYLDTVSAPFYMQFNHFAVHRPFEAKAEKVEKYQAKAALLPKMDSTEMYLTER